MKVLISDSLAKEGIEILKKSSIDVDVKTGMSPEELRSCIGDYEGLVIRSKTKVTSDIIKSAKKLKVVGRAGVGVDNVDITAATERGIVVMNTPGGNTISAAEHTVSMLLALSRNIPQANQSLKKGLWDKKKFTGTEVYCKVLGIIGLGKIGTEVASRAQSFGMRIIAYDPFISAEKADKLGIRLETFEGVLKKSDYITVHLPLTPNTKHIINDKEFGLMKQGARIINCARGGIIDENALCMAVKSGKLAGAAVDVFEKEPLPADSPLLLYENIIVTPHLAASTEEAQINVAQDIAHQIIDALQNENYSNAVNIPSIDPKIFKEIKPYFNLAERLGKLQRQLVDGHIKVLRIEYSGDVTNYNVTPITVAIIKGLLEPVLNKAVNYVNASFIARERGIKVVESKTSKAEDFANLITIYTQTDSGESSIAGTLFSEDDPRIVRINDYHVDAVPEGFMLVCINSDMPGIMGNMGTILGKHNVNIASMTLGRKKQGEQAVTVFNLDNEPPKKTLGEIECLKEIISVKLVKF